MKLCIFAALIFLPLSTMAAGDDYQDIGERSQEMYVAAGISDHKLGKLRGDKISALLGARNYYQNNWFVGGELEVSYLKYNEISLNESYGLAANVPIGKNFSFVGDSSIDIYGLVGYSMTELNFMPEKITVRGLKWGLGTDVSFSNFMVGVRWTQAELGNDDVRDKLREQNITLFAGYKF